MASDVIARFILERVGAAITMLFARRRDRKEEGEIEKGIAWFEAWFVR
jgi:hypothetical protein